MYDALVDYYQRTSQFAEPLLEDETARKNVERYIGDKDYRTFVDQSDDFYQQSRKEAADKNIPPYVQKLMDDNKATRELVENKIIKPQEEAETQRRNAYAQQQTEAAKDLMTKEGIDLPMLRSIAAYGDQLGIPDITDAYKHWKAALNKEKPAPALRAAISTPGVPGESGNDGKPPQNRTDLARRMAANLRSVRAS